MGQKRPPEKKLLVEGHDDRRVIPELIEANGVVWGETAADAVVFIDAVGSDTELLKPGLIETELKASGLRILGVLLDADQDAQARWQRIRARCAQAFPTAPVDLPADGVILENGDQQRFGAWIMPDNQSRGMMETFLQFLVPTVASQVWSHAQTVTLQAKAAGATFKDAHLDKANIHAWLAWCDPPGRQLHEAVMQRILEPSSPHAQPFVAWFCNLFQLNATGSQPA